MTIQAVNTTAGTLTYSAEGLTLSAGATVTVPLDILLDFYFDPQVVSDIKAGNLNISDTVTTYVGDGALQFLNTTITVNANGILTNTTTTMTSGSGDLIIPCNGMATVMVNISGTWTGNVTMLASVDNVTFGGVSFDMIVNYISASTLDGQIRSSSITSSGTDAGTGTYYAVVAGYRSLKIQNNVATGTLTVKTGSAPAPHVISAILAPVFVEGTLALSEDNNFGAVGTNTLRTAAQIGNATGAADFNTGATGAQTLRTVANQGAANTLANKWPVQVTDGTNTMPTMDAIGRSGFQKITDGTNTQAVKAASTAAVATDPAAVVSLSPNSPLPSGTNLLGKVGIDQTTVGTTNAVSLAQLGTNTVATGNGTTSAGTLRVSISSDSTGQTALAAGTNAIGTVQPGNTPNTVPWLVKPHDGTNPLYTPAAVLADGVSNPTEGRHATDNYLFNGTTWDRQRNNISSGSAIDTESLSGAGTTNGATQTNYNSRGAVFTFVTSALSGTSPSVTISVQYSYDGGTTFVTVPGATTAAIAAAATTVLQVYPGIATTANANVSSILPRTYRLQYVFTGSSTPKMTVNSYVNYVL